MATRVLFVRHGQSEWNAAGRWQGQADPPLSDLGRAQACAAAAALASVDAIFASDLRRAAETAAIISAELGVGPVVTDPDLRERDAGEWSGLTREEIERRYPGWLAPMAERHAAFAPAGSGAEGARRPTGWEPDESVLTRALRSLRRIEASTNQDVLAVTHGGLIYVLEHHLGGQVNRLANGEGRYITFVSGQAMLGERVLLIDDAVVTRPDQI